MTRMPAHRGYATAIQAAHTALHNVNVEKIRHEALSRIENRMTFYWNNREATRIVDGTVLRQRREELHLTQYELAKLVGTSKPMISRIERSEIVPSVGTLLVLAFALDIPLADFCKLPDLSVA